MANMSYCRFQNTEMDLRACCNAMDDAYTLKDMDLSNDEYKAMLRLVSLCQDVLDNFERLENAEDFEEEEDLSDSCYA